MTKTSGTSETTVDIRANNISGYDIVSIMSHLNVLSKLKTVIIKYEQEFYIHDYTCLIHV